jgi:hypothetical protein
MHSEMKTYSTLNDLIVITNGSLSSDPPVSTELAYTTAPERSSRSSRASARLIRRCPMNRQKTKVVMTK